jgi:hypothetical protein
VTCFIALVATIEAECLLRISCVAYLAYGLELNETLAHNISIFHATFPSYLYIDDPD